MNDLEIHPRSSQLLLLNGHTAYHFLFATGNLYTKYEVTMFTHYEDIKGDENAKNWGGLGG